MNSLLEYLVQYTEDLLADYWLLPSGWKNLSSYPGNLNSVILQLTPFVEYRFRVIAVNGIGPSKPSWPSEYYQTGGAGRSLFYSILVQNLGVCYMFFCQSQLQKGHIHTKDDNYNDNNKDIVLNIFLNLKIVAKSTPQL